jgi:hypothetical protein
MRGIWQWACSAVGSGLQSAGVKKLMSSCWQRRRIPRSERSCGLPLPSQIRVIIRSCTKPVSAIKQPAGVLHGSITMPQCLTSPTSYMSMTEVVHVLTPLQGSHDLLGRVPAVNAQPSLINDRLKCNITCKQPLPL